jgi:hypothetical protein
MKPPQSNTSQVTANNNNNSRVCFNCHETGHFMPVRSNNNFGNNNNNQQMRQP